MRIIQEGKLPDDNEYKSTCRHCSTIFEFNQKEAEYISDQRDGDCMKINCPFCNTPCYISFNSRNK